VSSGSVIRVLGTYESAVGDNDAVLLAFSPEGAFANAFTYGALGTNETGVDLELDPTQGVQGWITGTRLVGGDYSTWVAEINNTGLELEADGYAQTLGVRLVHTAHAPVSLLALGRPTLSSTTQLLAAFDAAVTTVTGFQTLLPTGGSDDIYPQGAVQYGENGLLIVGQNVGALPVASSQLLNSSASTLTWTNVLPGFGTPVPVVTSLPVTVTQVAGTSRDSGDTAGEPMFDYLHYPPPES
jgi:hypothetical protein